MFFPSPHLTVQVQTCGFKTGLSEGDRVPVRGCAGCPLVCGIYWGSRTEGPPNESSTTFQPAPSPASVSCKKKKEKEKRKTPGGEIEEDS